MLFLLFGYNNNAASDQDSVVVIVMLCLSCDCFVVIMLCSDGVGRELRGDDYNGCDVVLCLCSDCGGRELRGDLPPCEGCDGGTVRPIHLDPGARETLNTSPDDLQIHTISSSIIHM